MSLLLPIFHTFSGLPSSEIKASLGKVYCLESLLKGPSTMRISFSSKELENSIILADFFGDQALN